MAEYIDREKIRYAWWQNQDGSFTDGVTLQSVINDMPTEDVQKVKHGQWVEKEIQGVIDVMTLETTKHFICSVCGKDNKQKVNNYCPNCGAKMDGDSE